MALEFPLPLRRQSQGDSGLPVCENAHFILFPPPDGVSMVGVLLRVCAPVPPSLFVPNSHSTAALPTLRELIRVPPPKWKSPLASDLSLPEVRSLVSFSSYGMHIYRYSVEASPAILQLLYPAGFSKTSFLQL